MSEAKQTPKEWVAGSVLVDGRVPDDEAIVYVGGDADTGPEAEIVIRGPGAAHISRLIAAAPDMMEALRAEAEADQAQDAFERACGDPGEWADDSVDNLGVFALELRQRARELRLAALSKAGLPQ